MEKLKKSELETLLQELTEPLRLLAKSDQGVKKSTLAKVERLVEIITEGAYDESDALSRVLGYINQYLKRHSEAFKEDNAVLHSKDILNLQLAMGRIVEVTGEHEPLELEATEVEAATEQVRAGVLDPQESASLDTLFSWVREDK